MKKSLEEFKQALGVSDFFIDNDMVIQLSRSMRLQEPAIQTFNVLINEEIYEVTTDEVLVIFGIMRESQIGLYKNPFQEIYPVEYIFILWKNLKGTWPGDFIGELKQVQFEDLSLV